MNRGSLITGSDIYVNQVGIIHQPILKEILDEPCFIRILNIMTADLDELIDGATTASLFDIIIFLLIKEAEEDFSKQYDLAKFFRMIFPEFTVDKLTEDGLKLFSETQDKTITIGNKNFDIFREALVNIFHLQKGGKGSDFNPADEKAREIAEKLKTARNKIAIQKKETPPDMSDYVTILAVGLQMDMRNLLELTMYQFLVLLERYNLYVTFKLDMDLKLAGGSGLDAVEYWGKHIN